MANVIVFGTGITKHTKDISEYIAKKITADIYNAKKPEGLDLGKYDTVILGTNVHAGRPSKALLRFCAENKEQMAGKKTILFVSCMYDGEKGKKQADNIAKTFGTGEYEFFPSGGEKDANGIPLKVNDFIARYFGPVQ